MTACAVWPLGETVRVDTTHLDLALEALERRLEKRKGKADA